MGYALPSLEFVRDTIIEFRQVDNMNVYIVTDDMLVTLMNRAGAILKIAADRGFKRGIDQIVFHYAIAYYMGWQFMESLRHEGTLNLYTPQSGGILSSVKSQQQSVSYAFQKEYSIEEQSRLGQKYGSEYAIYYKMLLPSSVLI